MGEDWQLKSFLHVRFLLFASSIRHVHHVHPPKLDPKSCYGVVLVRVVPVVPREPCRVRRSAARSAQMRVGFGGLCSLFVAAHLTRSSMATAVS